MGFSNRYIVALDIQDKYVRCVQVKYSSRSCNIQKTSLKEIPSPEDNQDSSHDTHIAHVIKSLLQEMDIYPPKNVVTSISGRDAAVKLLVLPPVSGRNVKSIEEMVRYELMMHLPVNMDQMGYDHQIVGKSESGTRILTAAAKRSVLNRHLRLLLLAGVYPDVVTISSLALFNTFAEKAPESIGSGRVGLVCVRDSNGDMVVCEDGSLTYARSFAFQAHGSKEQLIREIHNSFDTYFKSLESENRNIENYLITEDGQLPSDLTEDDLPRILPGSRWEVHQAKDDLAFGLALAVGYPDPKSATSSPLRINLLKQIVQEKRATQKKATRAKLGRMAPAIAVLILLAVSGALWWQVHRAKEELYFIENARRAGKQRVHRISQMDEIEKGIQKQIESLDWVADNYPMVSYRLYKIAQTIPDNLWLKEVYIPDQQITRKKRKQQPISKLYVVGYAHEQHQIEEFLGNLRMCDCFSDVKQESTSEVRLAGKRVLEFRIALTSDPRRSESRIRPSAST